MFRTRDFILLFTVIVFLMAAIGATLFTQWRTGSVDQVVTKPTPTAITASTSDLVLRGVVPGDAESERLERLNRMRQKVAVVPLDTVQAESTPVVDETLAATSSEPDATESLPSQETGSLLCANHAPYAGFWDSRGLIVETREGALVVERTLETGPVIISQLPLRNLPAASPTCLASDVVGIATDGSLIRNDEVALYSIFGAETQIGYTLDGFPLHGVGTRRGDVCGGLVDETGQYRYELSAERDTIINCFASTPTLLP